jgi:hypothetical protein
MTLFTHAMCGVALASVLHFPYWMGILFSIIPDIDHLILFNRIPRKIEANSLAVLRSPFHEFAGIVIISAVSILLIKIGFYPSIVKFFLLCYIAHLFLDFVIGESYPFKYIHPLFSKKSVRYFNTFAEKLIVEMLFFSFFVLIYQIYRG